jgi:hypothetical protein
MARLLQLTHLDSRAPCQHHNGTDPATPGRLEPVRFQFGTPAVAAATPQPNLG